MRDDLNDLFRRDIDRIELPPPAVWLSGTGRVAPSRWRSLLAVPAALGVIALALVVAFTIQLARGELPQAAKSPSPSPSVVEASASPSPLTTPNASPMGPSPLATPIARPLPPSTAVRVDKTLPPSGEWALVLRRSYDQTPTDPNRASGPARPPTVDSIMAVPLTARATTQRDTISLLTFTSKLAEGKPVTDNLLREQFSPDGHRLVLSVTVGDGPGARLGLVVVDLVAGTVGALTTDAAYHDDTPAWSPTGDEIAFVRSNVTGSFHDTGIWLVRADGTGLRQLLGGADAPTGLSVFSWNADGTGIAFASAAFGSYNVLDMGSGRQTRVGTFNVQTGRGMGDWRAATPAFVGAFAPSPNGGDQILLTAADQQGRDARVILRETPLNTYFTGARWRPGSNDLLYVKLFQDPNVERDVGGAPAAPKNMRTIYVTDASGRSPKAVVSRVYESLFAAWSPDGRDIVYVQGLGVAGSVHLVAPDGTNDRVIQAYGGAPESAQDWLDLAVLSL